MLCFLETPVLRFALLPYYRRYHSTVQFLLNNLLIAEAMRHHIKMLKQFNVHKNYIRIIVFVNEMVLVFLLFAFKNILENCFRGVFRTQSNIKDGAGEKWGKR